MIFLVNRYKHLWYFQKDDIQKNLTIKGLLKSNFTEIIELYF